MGARLEAGLRHLQERYEIIGDVRGLGLLYGVELVEDRETRVPDAAIGRAITHRCMELGLSMNIVAIGVMAAIWRNRSEERSGEIECKLMARWGGTQDEY